MRGVVQKPDGYCWPTSYKVLGVLSLGEVSLAFWPSKKACWAHQFQYLGVGQQYPSGFLVLALCRKHHVALRTIARAPQTEYISIQALLAHHPHVILEEHGEER